MVVDIDALTESTDPYSSFPVGGDGIHRDLRIVLRAGKSDTSEFFRNGIVTEKTIVGADKYSAVTHLIESSHEVVAYA